MSSSRPLPEAVRGCWYYLPVNADHDPNGPRQVIAFGVDGSFVRYEIKKSRRKEAESGDYTFDGNFLILRGRRTHTFRVHRPSFWQWKLEGKKKHFRLLRGFAPIDEEVATLPDAERRDISLLPLRARVEADFDGANVIHRLVYEHGAEDRRLLGTFCVKQRPDSPLWIGLTPLVRGIEAKIWKRIVRESYLGMFLDQPDDVGQVTLHLFDSHESIGFDYGSAS